HDRQQLHRLVVVLARLRAGQVRGLGLRRRAGGDEGDDVALRQAAAEVEHAPVLDQAVAGLSLVEVADEFHGCGWVSQSTLLPASRMTRAYLRTSDARWLSISSGVLGATSKPALRYCSCTDGSASALWMAALMRLTTSAGVPAGAR